MKLSRRATSRAHDFLSLSLALLLVLAQGASQSHSFEHVRYDLALAHYTATVRVSATGASDDGAGGLPTLGHSVDRCIEFHDFDCVSVARPLRFVPDPVLFFTLRLPGLPLVAAEHPPFSSRAPPVSLSS